MSVSVNAFGNQLRALSKRELCLRPLKRSSVMLSAAFVSFLSLLPLQSAVALPKTPNLPIPKVVSSVSTLPHEIYYYRHRYYPYRYHGAYYGHRYYRYGRWYYY